jgi:RimJ/RimL family protein N-acetyltransferase
MPMKYFFFVPTGKCCAIGKEQSIVLLITDLQFWDCIVIEALLSPANTGSSAVLESTGFVKEAHLKENFYFRGKFDDTLIYSKLNK